ncbi:MAG: hypothetical protein P9M03_05475 [Candidatus Theseobacter exili]|nr:hypothetical protein [Candidatus Theseobacter exili]
MNFKGEPFNTLQKEFDSKDDVKQWIILNQFSRRNLSAYDRSLLALKLKPLIAEKAKENQIRKPKSVLQKSAEQKIDTRKNISQMAGVSHDTIHKVEHIEERATDEVKGKISNGEISINQEYQAIRREEKIEAVKEKFVDEEMGTIIGMVLVLNLLVQFLKPLIDKIKKVPTRYVVWVLALALSVIYKWIDGEFTVETIFVMLINTIVITLAAMKSYELTTK